MEVVYIGSVFCALITAIALFRARTPYQAFADRLLATFLIGASYCALLYLLIISDKIALTPHLFKTAAPVNFILPPLAFLYVRSVLKNETGFKKSDWFHSIPFFIILVNYLPFYFQSSEVKLKIITGVGAENWIGTGFINEELQFILRETQVIIYLVFQWKLILNFNRDPFVTTLKAHAQQVLTWTKVFTGIISINFFCIVLSAILMSNYKQNNLAQELLEACDILFGLGFFLMSSYLLINPSVLYGLPFIPYQQPVKEKTLSPLEKEKDNTNGVYEIQLEQLLSYFRKEKPYLKQGLSIAEVSVDLKIPPRSISFILNNHLGLRFNDFVNGYRIKYIVENLEDDYLANYKIESLAGEAGFSSARTMYRAFLKTHNMSPAEYIAEHLKK